MAKTILFRADGNASTGLGHLYRLFSLVEMVKEDYNFVFLTKEESTLDVIPKDYQLRTIPEHISITQEPEWINAQFPSNSHSIIADGYHFDTKYQKQLKQLGYNIVYIDDLAKEEIYADIVINHSPYLKTSDFKQQSYTHLALGTQFALLRPEFLKAAKETRTIKNIDTAFVCFGGADPHDLTIKAVKALLRIKRIEQIHVVLGGAYKHEALMGLSHQYPKRIITHRNLSEQELVAIMKSSDFAIAPASTILYELCCVKMPILSGFYVDNQELIYKGFVDKGAIYEGGNMQHYSQEDFLVHIESILLKDNFNKIINAQHQLFDSDIELRHKKLIKQIC